MDNLRSVIELMFTKRDVSELLKSLTNVNENTRSSEVVDRGTFNSLFISEYHRYSENQLDSLFDITNDRWSYNNVLYAGNQEPVGERTVFNLLSSLTSQMLVISGGMPYCRYEEYLRWNEASRDIGEDILVTNFLAAADFKDNISRVNFDWEPFILTTNRELKNILSKGIAELHNHLKGSSLIFTLNWLAVMNFPRKYGKRQFKDMKNFKGGYWEITLAAFLRAWLYKEIYAIQDTPIEKSFKQFLKENDKSVFIQMNVASVQDFISRLRYRSGADVDYAIPSHLPISTENFDSRTCLIGERQLLYKCFSAINRGEKSVLFKTLFYAYLIVKAKFRYAMVQINDVIGFANFSYYDSKKSNLLKALDSIPVYKNKLVEIGVKLAVQKSCVKHIEYRITPEDTASKLQKELNNTDRHANSGDSHGYIIHFIKQEDRITGKGKVEEGTICRNYEARKKYSREADGVRTLLRNGNRQITGIDAANSEFFCRPEVFGTVFRRTRHTQPKTDMAYIEKLPPLNVGVTYHVGEDFYDIIDGLRAMEEAIIFLNLRNGDRIGHGTALGLDVTHYYDEKHFTVVMPKQVMLDNMVWLLDKIEKYGIDGGTFLHEAKKEFYRLREDIYHTHLEEQTFVDAWLLRGDEPSLYLDATREPKRQNLVDIYQLNMDNRVVPARSDEDARNLYYRYHYDYKVKAEGYKSKEWKIEMEHRASFVRILKTIQEKMQEEIAYKHIAIECNPTSNLRIGNIPRYVEHPIVKFNNEDLIRTDGKVDKSAQISVSINTDDAGIFATSLEKEFTLMALALEKETTEDGEPKYQQRSVYRWLENIRENAFIQKFDSVPEKERKNNWESKDLSYNREFDDEILKKN